VITTHYSNLKHYADEHEGLINGAMLYDRHEMRPLFVLETGRPGSSFAIEIARKIGLPEQVIADASAKVGSDYIDMDKFLQDIVRDKRYWENKRQIVRLQEKKLAELTERYESDMSSLNQQRKEILAKAKVEAASLLKESNALIENTVRGIKEAQAEKERTKELRKDLESFKDSVLRDENSEKEEALMQQRLANKVDKIRRKEAEKAKRALGEPMDGSGSGSAEKKVVPAKVVFAAKDTVRIKGQNVVGVLLEIKGLKGIVAFGSVKSTVLLEQLEHARPQKEKENPYTTLGRRTSDEIREKKLQFKQDIDVRGQRGDEAIQTVMYFVDDAIMTGVSRIRILHGTGTGALRQLIRQYLATVPGVHSYADEHIQFGGAGITVVDLD
jgi:DNA mismatch repair protein MutS2